MPSCEMCGKEMPSLRRALVEGTPMSVCGGCVKFGVEQAGIQTEVTGRSRVQAAVERRVARGRTRDIYDQMQEELVEDYGERIRKARTARNLSIEELGAKIKERVPVLAKVESGSFHPPDALIQKLERELNIKLTQKPEQPAATGGQPPRAGEKALTLGDLIKKQMEKK